MKRQYTLQADAKIDPGKRRNINQDRALAYIRPPDMGDALGLFIVADGMGGHQAGEIASQLTIDTIRENLSWLLDQDDQSSTSPSYPQLKADEETDLATQLKRRLELAVQEANKAIYNYAYKNPTNAGNLGSTVTCALVSGNIAVIANVGDSRTYKFSDQILTQLTNDHSYVGQLVKEGQLQPEEVFDHPQRNVITRALGNRPDVTIDLMTCTLNGGDRLLLCSDGVWEMIRDQNQIVAMIQVDPLETSTSQFVEAANDYGGVDNIGVVVAELLSSS
jgi:protein phosphatase